MNLKHVPVSDAIVSAIQYCPLRTLLHMQSGPGLCKNRPVDMYIGGHVHEWTCTWVDMYMTVYVCARVSERACTQPTYMQHEYSPINYD